MLRLIVLLSIVLLTSCAARKERKLAKNAELSKTEEVAPELSAASQVSSSERPMREEDMIDIEGTVRIKKDGCPVLIEMVAGDLFSVVYPVNLPDVFKVEGQIIEFSYQFSRAQMIEGCKADRVISVSDVKVKKK